jgi:hypothetical protein
VAERPGETFLRDLVILPANKFSLIPSREIADAESASRY